VIRGFPDNLVMIMESIWSRGFLSGFSREFDDHLFLKEI
jgi:hypothetical protein